MTRDARSEVRTDLLSRIPRWYSPTLHLAVPTGAGIAIAAIALGLVHGLRGWELAFVPIFLALANAVEWHAHRDLLHRRTWPLEALYVRHTPQHHAVFVAEDLFIRDWREVRLVLLPAWGIVAVVVMASPVAVAFAALGLPNVAALWVATVAGYVLAYEWLHLAVHLPAEGPVGRLRATRWLRRHHERHHAPQLMQRWNFNVTLPLWDHLRGTSWRPGSAPSPAIPRRA